jgi:hypothetical protein
MKDFQPLSARLLWRGKRVWLGFGKPAGQIQGGGGWEGTQAKEILTKQLIEPEVCESLYRISAARKSGHTWPSSPPTSAFAITWAITAP